MRKIAVLAEKPSVARDIAKVLNCHKKGNGYLEGEKYIVTWALGHLVTLADPESYDDKYKTWKLEDLPMLPQLKLVVIKKTSKQFNAVKTQLTRKDVTEIVIATDAGREGELVARWIIEKAKVKKPLKRLWISSVTDKAILEGFKKLKRGSDYENLYASAVARSEADWYVGLNATRALTCKHNAQLSCGRVQTPTLAMIARREEVIKNFNPQQYYGLVAQLSNFQLIWQEKKSKSNRTFKKEERDQLLLNLKGNKAIIKDVEKVEKKSYAPNLYDLTELQRDAHNKFGYSAKETLSVMQNLYERHKLVTYPRTDSRYLSSDIVDTLKARLEACSVPPYRKAIAKVLQKTIKGNKSFVNDQKVSDHHAIIPTEQTPHLEKLSNKENKIYDLIVKRFIAVLYPAFEYEQIKVYAEIHGEIFIATGKRIVSNGWKDVYDYEIEKDDIELIDQRLPPLKIGERLEVQILKPTSGETKPPKPFNEGTLLSAMENPTAVLDQSDEELKKKLRETGGLGTVATRADIIEKLFHSFLIEKNGKEISLTSKGRQLLNLVPDELKSPALTANWENRLELIAKGKLQKTTFIEDMKEFAKSTVHQIKTDSEKFKHDNLTSKRCPECNKLLLEVKNKRGKMLVCQDRECNYKKGINKVTNARCPQCKKKLNLHGQGEAQTFVCQCGHREKLSAFNKRRNKEKNSKASKRDVSKYLKEQHKEEPPLNTALADALAKLKLNK
ncbi:DNA topoisomerase III [Lottiidibacillus patelloidae]|uniref:DNA topoisomerase 3 n=1 Tax=Lottiidibacillus patelloidae TaxID=2670334 RepID=A0A263BSJ5_9BACI|nr:DNA topoisomerase III [Lottiidibacillus patelloidae]OZM56684.1 DNA topoisomerase III [Lottiidibacillus patelloidae]